MTDEEVAAIRTRAERWLMPDVGSLDLRNDVLALLAEREQLRKIVESVAEADNSDNSVCYQLCAYGMRWTDDYDQVTTHSAPCVVEQARALLNTATSQASTMQE